MESPFAKRERYLYTAIISVAWFALIAGVPIFGADKRVALAVYGERPFGVPWQLCHVGVSLLLAAPMPWGASNYILLHRATAPHDRFLLDLLYLPFVYYFANEESIKRPLRRVLFVEAFYLLAVVTWIVYTGIHHI